MHARARKLRRDRSASRSGDSFRLGCRSRFSFCDLLAREDVGGARALGVGNDGAAHCCRICRSSPHRLLRVDHLGSAHCSEAFAAVGIFPCVDALLRLDALE
jgi:hypothetical protein|tara:strand:+ start:552 stop:857 length:306 start_codon:yes stop_codon:yes gene_type:complete